MKIITIEVKSCEGCLNHYETVNWLHYCTAVGKNINDMSLIPNWCPLSDAPSKLTEAIQNMIAVEDIAFHCSDCGVGGSCPKHDKAFWEFWAVVKKNLPMEHKE